MRAWSKVQLGELLSNSLPKTFYYPLIEKKNYLPTISVVRTPITMSPKLYDSPGVPILEIPTPQYQNVRDLSEFRLTPMLPPSIAEQQGGSYASSDSQRGSFAFHQEYQLVEVALIIHKL